MPFDIHYKDKETKVTKTVVEDRYLVVCKNVEEWEKYVIEKRKIKLDENAKYLRKIGMDKGGDHFKICGNLIDPNEKSNMPSDQHNLSSGVKATYLLAVCEKIPETFENVQKIMGKLDLGPINFEDCIAADLKMINMICGIQSNSATCPCYICECPKKDFLNGKAQGKATPRTKRRIR